MKRITRKIITTAILASMLSNVFFAVTVSANAAEGEDFYNKTVISNENPLKNPINDLSLEYNNAKNAYGVGDNYTEKARSAMEAALKNAERILDNPSDASNEEIQEAIKLLQDAVANLKSSDVDTSKLGESIGNAEYYDFREIRYSGDTFAKFSSAFTHAKSVFYYGQTQESIDSAKTRLDTAMENLQSKYQVLFGDVNLDREINIRDATMIQKGIAHIIDFDEIQEISADFNDDALVNVRDATAIQRALVGLAY